MYSRAIKKVGCILFCNLSYSRQSTWHIGLPRVMFRMQNCVSISSMLRRNCADSFGQVEMWRSAHWYWYRPTLVLQDFWSNLLNPNMTCPIILSLDRGLYISSKTYNNPLQQIARLQTLIPPKLPKLETLIWTIWHEPSTLPPPVYHTFRPSNRVLTRAASMSISIRARSLNQSHRRHHQTAEDPLLI